ncbi:basic proline-rich protein-like [Passer domesticus]|uniref:basic proline-rich protein-like n=1 Tax=Passer domesticus TaxID=48849 RepID=UPI0030FEBC0B
MRAGGRWRCLRPVRRCQARRGCAGSLPRRVPRPSASPRRSAATALRAARSPSRRPPALRARQVPPRLQHGPAAASQPRPAASSPPPLSPLCLPPPPPPPPAAVAALPAPRGSRGRCRWTHPGAAPPAAAPPLRAGCGMELPRGAGTPRCAGCGMELPRGAGTPRCAGCGMELPRGAGTPRSPADPGDGPPVLRIRTPRFPADPEDPHPALGIGTPLSPADPGGAPPVLGIRTPRFPADPGGAPAALGIRTPRSPADPGDGPPALGIGTPLSPADPGGALAALRCARTAGAGLRGRGSSPAANRMFWANLVLGGCLPSSITCCSGRCFALRGGILPSANFCLVGAVQTLRSAGRCLGLKPLLNIHTGSSHGITGLWHGLGWKGPQSSPHPSSQAMGRDTFQQTGRCKGPFFHLALSSSRVSSCPKLEGNQSKERCRDISEAAQGRG